MMFDSEDAPGAHSATGTTRRALFAGGGAACLALLLGACGSDEQPGNSTTGGQTGGPSTPPTPSAAEGPGQILAKAADVPAKGGTVVGTVLLVRLADGGIKAYDARCPHKDVPVDPPAEGVILCAAHGSEFKLEDGSVTKGPAKAGLKVIEVKLDGDNIVRV